MRQKTLLLAFFMLVGFVVQAQQKITGTVISSEDNLPLPGVSIYVKGNQTVGTATNIDGKYTLTVPQGSETLVFSSVGMQDKEVAIGGQSVIDVTLEPAALEMDEVVVVGYGTVKKSELTGSVASVSAEELTAKPVASVSQALQGKVAGVQIVSTSGRAGDETQISIRGNGSLSASNNVLYVIDGVPQESISNIAPEDIESMEVLKDAASTAIYGSRASNGVVLVTTKRGKYNGKSTISVNSSYGLQKVIKEPELLNAAQYKQIHDVARTNFENDIANGILSAPTDPSVLTPLAETGNNTDWIGLVLRDKSQVQKHQISISSGSEDTRMYISGSMFEQDGVIKMDSYKKFRTRFNIEHRVNDFFKIGLQSYFSASEATPLQEDNNIYQPWSAAMKASPMGAPYNEDGEIARYNYINPLFAFERQISDKWQDLGGTFYFDVSPIDGLKWHSAYSGNIANNRYNRYDAPSTRRGENGDGEPWGYGYYSTANNRDFQIENTVTYSGRLFDNKLSYTVLAGHSYQEWRYEDSYVQGENFPSDDLRWLVSAGEITNGRSYYRALSLESYFSRFQFSWDKRYNLMLSIRRDGSSKFAEGNKWGAFPAISAGWNISEEDFFNVAPINTLKIRASLGYTGNQSGISYATGQNLIGSGYNYNGNPGLASSELYNPNLIWEKGRASNIGINIDMFDNRFHLTADVYEKLTQDLLYRISVPNETGFLTMMSNEGEVLNQGFEVETSFDIFKDAEFNWSLAANFTYNKNEVIEIGSDKDYYTTGFVSVIKEGESMGSFYLVESLGVAKEEYQYTNEDGDVTRTVQAGDMIYNDLNGDGLIDENDRKVYNGGIAPMYGGLSSHMNYKGFDLNITAQYSIGKKVYAMYQEDALNGGNIGYPSYSVNMIDDMMDYWSPDNLNAENPRPHLSTEISSWNLRRSSRFLEDADYLRITDITLGYNFEGVDISFIRSLRVYLQARNPFTFTKYSGLDPEVQYVDPDRDNNKVVAGVDSNGIPNIKTFLIGLNVKF